MNRKHEEMLLRSRHGKKILLQYYVTRKQEIEKETFWCKLLSYLKRHKVNTGDEAS